MKIRFRVAFRGWLFSEGVCGRKSSGAVVAQIQAEFVGFRGS